MTAESLILVFSACMMLASGRTQTNITFGQGCSEVEKLESWVSRVVRYSSQYNSNRYVATYTEHC